MKPSMILLGAADLIERTGFTRLRCAEDKYGNTVASDSDQAVAYCVSGAARMVAGHRGPDGMGTAAEFHYTRAMDCFCAHVGTMTVMGWADHSGRTADEAIAMLREVAGELNRRHTREEIRERWNDGLDMWGPNKPEGWSDELRLAQIDAGLIPDGLWGPQCDDAAVDIGWHGVDAEGKWARWPWSWWEWAINTPLLRPFGYWLEAMLDKYFPVEPRKPHR